MEVSDLKFPGVGIFISDFLMPTEDVQAIFQPMLARNLDVYAIQVLGKSDFNPASLIKAALAVDSETKEEVDFVFTEENSKEYAKILDQHQASLSSLLKSFNIPLITFDTSKSLEAIATTELPKLGFLF
jgi:hypothetical protein